MIAKLLASKSYPAFNPSVTSPRCLKSAGSSSISREIKRSKRWMNHLRLIISEYTSLDFNVFPCKLKSIVLRITDLASFRTDSVA